jgi:hypothetical protein
VGVGTMTMQKETQADSADTVKVSVGPRYATKGAVVRGAQTVERVTVRGGKKNTLTVRAPDELEALDSPNADDYELAEKAATLQATGVLSLVELLDDRLNDFTKSYAETSEKFNSQMDSVRKEQDELMKQLGGEF